MLTPLFSWLRLLSSWQLDHPILKLGNLELLVANLLPPRLDVLVELLDLLIFHCQLLPKVLILLGKLLILDCKLLV